MECRLTHFYHRKNCILFELHVQRKLKIRTCHFWHVRPGIISLIYNHTLYWPWYWNEVNRGAMKKQLMINYWLNVPFLLPKRRRDTYWSFCHRSQNNLGSMYLDCFVSDCKVNLGQFISCSHIPDRSRRGQYFATLFSFSGFSVYNVITMLKATLGSMVSCL